MVITTVVCACSVRTALKVRRWPHLLLTMHRAALRNPWHTCREVLNGLKFPAVESRDIVNRSGGMGDGHDGCPFSEVAATIAANKAQGAFEPLLTKQLGQHSAHVLKCMLQLSKELALYRAESSVGVSFASCSLSCPTVPRLRLHALHSISLPPHRLFHTIYEIHLDSFVALHAFSLR